MDTAWYSQCVHRIESMARAGPSGPSTIPRSGNRRSPNDDQRTRIKLQAVPQAGFRSTMGDSHWLGATRRASSPRHPDQARCRIVRCSIRAETTRDGISIRTAATMRNGPPQRGAQAMRGLPVPPLLSSRICHSTRDDCSSVLKSQATGHRVPSHRNQDSHGSQGGATRSSH